MAEIDRIVVAQADDDSAWDDPIHVRVGKGIQMPIPSDVAARAVFFARLHREPSVRRWLERVIRERLEMEEAAFSGLKRDMAAKGAVQAGK